MMSRIVLYIVSWSKLLTIIRSLAQKYFPLKHSPVHLYEFIISLMFSMVKNVAENLLPFSKIIVASMFPVLEFNLPMYCISKFIIIFQRF
ncbi:hypothetical protein WH50_14015 [Pokkaliibacter plantistimulans]|uniref:Uncharacterized protein n=1 Tax=Pokkaliibacter plantistimulans TaxID=1635171 RepID=A0ABX5M1C8_9GAMM|nr:hypothetical protein WH50_14015 [Pokkaliibacter plantistimulans]